MDLLDTWECGICGAYNVVGEEKCEVCGADKKDCIKAKGKLKKKKEGELIAIQEMPLPRAKGIINYTIKQNETANFAFKLLEKKIVDLFIHYRVTYEFYAKNHVAFEKRIKDIYRPIYFAIIRSELQGSRKKLNTQFQRVLDKIDKLYNIKK